MTMKGKNIFTRQEAQEIERLIRIRCATDSSRQKTIRNKMRDIGFYGSDFHIKDMTVEKFQQLIKSQQIKIVGEEDAVASIPPISYIDKPKAEEMKTSLSVATKQGLAPWVGNNPIVLILGTLPTDISLKKQAYYQNKSKNSFWKIMHSLWPEDKYLDDIEFVMKHHIALWDCLQSAERKGNTDSGFGKIKNPNDINHFLSTHPSIKTIILNGKTDTTDFFYQYFGDIQKRYKIKSLSSTSNNNTHSSFEEKLSEWIFVKQLCE